MDRRYVYTRRWCGVNCFDFDLDLDLVPVVFGVVVMVVVVVEDGDVEERPGDRFDLVTLDNPSILGRCFVEPVPLGRVDMPLPWNLGEDMEKYGDFTVVLAVDVVVDIVLFVGTCLCLVWWWDVSPPISLMISLLSLERRREKTEV